MYARCARAHPRTCIGVETRISLILIPARITYTPRISLISAFACCGASVCVSAVERGLLVRVPSSPRGGLLGGRRWSSRERTVASRRLDGERGRIVQHVTAILLGRERLRGCNLFFFPPTFHPGYSCVVPVGRKHLGVATFLIIHRWMSTNCASKRSLSLSFFILRFSSFIIFKIGTQWKNSVSDKF